MDWRKILLNIGVVAAVCVAAEKTGLMGAAPDWATIGFGVLMCVVSNQIGLHQQKP